MGEVTLCVPGFTSASLPKYRQMSVVITSLSIPVAGTKYVARRCDDIVMVSQAVEGRKMQSGWMIEHFDPGSICRGSIKPGMIRGICMELSIGSFFPFQFQRLWENGSQTGR